MPGNTFGKYLKTLRKSCHYTQEFVASKLDISRQAYSHYETGRVVPPNDVCISLANMYNVNAEELIYMALYSSDVNINKLDSAKEHENINGYIDFIENDADSKNRSSLSIQEKELLFYYSCLRDEDKEDLIDFLKIKYRRLKK